jgi:pimeloyl-ACP methyl ester carboxylesterase
MPRFEREGVSLYYEEFGTGYPLLLFAPGGMNSAIDFWHKSPWDPTAKLASNFRVIAMDQRNAGQSQAEISATDGWATYTADHVALLDHLGIEQTHIMGGCIGSSYCLGLIQAAPQRVSAAVLQNPIGLGDDNRQVFIDMFDDWTPSLQPRLPNLTESTLASFRQNMFGGEFVFSVSREFVRSCSTPLLVCAGADQFHPTATAREIVELAPHAELLLKWREPEIVADTVARAKSFLLDHTPTNS